MPGSSKKTASVFTRVSPELKEQAEAVLNQLQIPMATALNMFLQQVVNQQGIPFDLHVARRPVDYDALSKEQLDTELQRGFNDFKTNNTFSAASIDDEFKEWLNDRSLARCWSSHHPYYAPKSARANPPPIIN